MQIIEIYKSLQGESTYAGLPCVFVRLTGCNLRCTWCDSEYTFTGGAADDAGRNRSTKSRRLSPDGGLVEITGGEPMLQEREVVLADGAAAGRGLHRAARDQRRTAAGQSARRVVKIVDVKCPHSGEGGHLSHGDNLDACTREDEVKFVISDRTDYEFARDFMAQHELERAGQGGLVFAGISQGRDRRARCVALPAGSARTGGMDAGRRCPGTPGTADS